MSCSNRLGTLFEKPHKWNSSHRDLLRVKEDQVSSEELVGSAYLPQDGDQELETIAAHFAGPEKESIVDGTVWFDYKESPFWSVFTILRDTMKLEEEEKEAEEGEPQSDYFRMSKLLIESIFDAVTVRVDLDTWFVTLPDSTIHFHIDSCSVNGALKPTGAIGRSSDVHNKISLPVITFSVINPEENPDAVCHEIPQVLLQAILMFQRNTILKTHTGFALRIQGTKLRLSSAKISQASVHNLSHDKPPIGDLTLHHSVAYDLRESKHRREVLRILIGILRRLDAAQY